jgi:hypothetical protein
MHEITSLYIYIYVCRQVYIYTLIYIYIYCVCKHTLSTHKIASWLIYTHTIYARIRSYVYVVSWKGQNSVTYRKDGIRPRPHNIAEEGGISLNAIHARAQTHTHIHTHHTHTHHTHAHTTHTPHTHTCIWHVLLTLRERPGGLTQVIRHKMFLSKACLTYSEHKPLYFAIRNIIHTHG